MRIKTVVISVSALLVGAGLASAQTISFGGGVGGGLAFVSAGAGVAVADTTNLATGTGERGQWTRDQGHGAMDLGDQAPGTRHQ